MGKVVMAGIPKWCCARLRAYQEVGMGLPLLYQVLGPDRVRTLRSVAEQTRLEFADEID